MQFVTYHGVDDEKIEQVNMRELFSKPMQGGMYSVESAALDVYVKACETSGPEAGKRAWLEFWQKQNRKS